MRNFIIFPLWWSPALWLPAKPFLNAQSGHQQPGAAGAALVRGRRARYLKNKCNRSDLPADETINRAAVNVGKARGWGILTITLSQRSDRLYQQLSRTVPRKPQNAASLIASWRHLLIACAAINSAYFIALALFYSAFRLSSIFPPGQSSSAARVNVLPLKLNT
jgi:hypothetical protein